MTAADMIARLREHGYQVMLDGVGIVIRPRPNAKTLAHLRAIRPAIYQELLRTPLASHRYVLWSRGNPQAGVCIACRKPPLLHVDDALGDPLVVADPSAVALLEARAIVVVAIAGAR